jgi:hypothetical protein
MQFVVMNGEKRMSPLFYHEQLGKAAQRENNKPVAVEGGSV